MKIEKPFQLPPAPPNVWKGPTQQSWAFLFSISIKILLFIPLYLALMVAQLIIKSGQ